MRQLDISGQKFGRLTVLSKAESKRHLRGTRSRWLCSCECGATAVILGEKLRAGRTKSCGCFRVDFSREKATTHGLRHHPLYPVWCMMKQRCHLPTSHKYPDYGGRGIEVCDRWRHSFPAFLADMGERPGPGHSIDRIDNGGNYEPGNCRWADGRAQRANRRDSLKAAA